LIANDTGITYETVRRILRKTTKYIAVAIENGDSVRMGFGTFHTRIRGPKPARDFKTGQAMILPPKYKLTFTPSNYLEGVVSKKNVTLGIDAAVELDGPEDDEEE
jgi:nucleoid DNA-binding protein